MISNIIAHRCSQLWIFLQNFCPYFPSLCLHNFCSQHLFTTGVLRDTSFWEVCFFGPKSILFLLKYVKIYFFCCHTRYYQVLNAYRGQKWRRKVIYKDNLTLFPKQVAKFCILGEILAWKYNKNYIKGGSRLTIHIF